jgi:hypothetical protein
MPDRATTAWSLLLLLLAVGFLGCWGIPVPRTTTTAIAPTTPPIEAPLDQIPASDLPAALTTARVALAAARARVAGLETAVKAERAEHQRRLLAWASGIAILATLACAALAVFLPVFRKRMAIAAVACVVVLVLAQTIAVSLAWLPLVGVAVALIALVSTVLLGVRAIRSTSTPLSTAPSRP